jgi:uncharacterized LabA/DUF88 family protein
MKKTALLIDGGWFSKGLGTILSLPNKWPTAEQVVRNARLALQSDEELFRIFYYDCPPFGETVTNPINAQNTNYASTGVYGARKQFIHDMGQQDHVALRLGELKVRGWDFSKSFRQSLLTPSTTPVSPTAADVYPNLEQKGVDMRIGIDVATLSLKRIVDRIILFSGDADMIPAMKLARREGLQVFLVRLNPWTLKPHLIEDSDGVRSVTPVA